MKRFYFIFPLVIMVLFSTFYWRFSKASDEAERITQEKVALAKQADEMKKKADEAKSREDSEKRVATRLAEEQKKEEDRLAKWEAESKRIEEETRQYTTQVAVFTAESAALDKQLSDLRATKEIRTRDLLESASAVELSAIEKRNAELEIQRLTEMVARKVANTSVVKQ